MFKRDYTISGITQELALRGEKYFREDLKFYLNRKTGEVLAKITLTPFEAIRLRISIIKFNLTHPYVLKISKNKGKRIRV